MKEIAQIVDYLALLARLELDEEQKKVLAAQLDNILDAARRVQELDTSGVEPTAHVVSSRGTLREDEVKPSLSLEEVMQNVPLKEGSLFRVPSMSGSGGPNGPGGPAPEQIHASEEAGDRQEGKG